MLRLARIITARLRTIGLALGTALLLAGCSTLQLGYNQAHTLLYWWIDGYADLGDMQSARLRQDIDGLLAWHRQQELPAYAQRLRQWRTLAAQDLTAEQVCREADALRTATGPDADHGSTSTVVWRSIDRPSASKGARPATSATFTRTEPVCRLCVSRPMPDANTAPVGCVRTVCWLAAPTLVANDGSSASPR